MPVLGKRVSAVLNGNSEPIAVITEAASLSIPSFVVYTDETIPNLIQRDVYPMGTRISYLKNSSKPQIPILIYKIYSNDQARPLDVYPLHNAVDVTITYNTKTDRYHLFWWWNAWSPDYEQDFSTNVTSYTSLTLPKPPSQYYKQHSVPSEETPPWLKSVIPNTNPGVFDPRRPFWIAPIMEGYFYDYYRSTLEVGDSKVGEDPKLKNTYGLRKLRDMIERGLVNYPGPTESDFNTIPSEERDLWEKSGGIEKAGAYLRELSLQDSPQFQSIVRVNPITNESEMMNLPGYQDNIPPSANIEDFLVITNSLKAHYDHSNLTNSNRVLMHSSGFILDNVTLESKKKVLQTSGNINYPEWPSTTERVKDLSILVIDHPKVVGSYPTKTNYQTQINSDTVSYPLIENKGIGKQLYNDGLLSDLPTDKVFQEPCLDWIIQDPTPGFGRDYDIFREEIDRRSF
jgi:hypothetical protein